MKAEKLLCIFCFWVSSLAAAPEDYVAFAGQNVRVFCAAEDSIYAREAAHVLEKVYQELAIDFELAHQDSVTVIIPSSRSEFREYARGQLPRWTKAFAVPSEKVMFIKSPRWSRAEKSFQVSLVHELLHLVLGQKMK